MQRKIVVITAGLGVPSSSRMLADQLAAATTAQLQELGTQVSMDVVELRDVAVDIANHLVTGFAPPQLAEVIAKVTDADALIAVTPVFSASYSGLFKSFFDVLDPKVLDGMPVLIGATGGSTRHSLVLDVAVRPLLSYFRARTLATGVYASPEDWGAAESGVGGLDVRIAQAAGELANALAPQGSAADAVEDRKAARREHEQEKMESLPFEQLLAQISGR
jgi:FMN reductase